MYDQTLLEWANATLTKVSTNTVGNQVWALPSDLMCPPPLPAIVQVFTYGGIVLRENVIFVAHWYSRPRKALLLLTQSDRLFILFADQEEFRNALHALRHDRRLWSAKKIRRS